MFPTDSIIKEQNMIKVEINDEIKKRLELERTSLEGSPHGFAPKYRIDNKC